MLFPIVKKGDVIRTGCTLEQVSHAEGDARGKTEGFDKDLYKCTNNNVSYYHVPPFLEIMDVHKHCPFPFRPDTRMMKECVSSGR